MSLLLLLPLACADYEDPDVDEFRGGPGPSICSACQYKTATYSVSAGDLSGGTLQSATAETDVTHTGTCPYSGYSAPCVASSDFDVECQIQGAGNYSFSYSPNGLKTAGGSTATGKVVLVVALTGGGTKTVRKTLSLTTPTTTTQPQTFLCGGDVEIDIVD